MTRFSVTVDVEEDLPGLVPRSFLGVDEGLPRLLGLLDELRIPADFFFLSSIVRARPELTRAIADGGFGIGNHGLDHEFLCAKSPARQQSDIVESTKVLESITGERPLMFRAPGFSADSTTLGILDRLGYSIDSSVLPGRFVRRLRLFSVYDHRGAPTEPFHPHAEGPRAPRLRLLEIPVTENPLRPGAPLGLGALIYFGETRLVEVVRKTATNNVLFLVHPWELIDVDRVYPSLPMGYANGCSADLEPLRRFLLAIKGSVQIASLDAIAAEHGST